MEDGEFSTLMSKNKKLGGKFCLLSTSSTQKVNEWMGKQSETNNRDRHLKEIKAKTVKYINNIKPSNYANTYAKKLLKAAQTKRIIKCDE